MKKLPTSIYQIFTGRWQSASLIQHPGQVFSKLQELNYSPLSHLGIDTIYLLGLWDNTGPIIVNIEASQDITNHPDRLPSPFAITNHTSPNPLLGNLDQLRSLIEYFHQHHFQVITDFVPNHTSTVHPWVTTNPDYYASFNGQKIAEFNSDVYKLNYQNQQLATEMIEILTQIQHLGFDGVRCDMAHLVPIDFWQKCTKILNKDTQFTFLAEVYPESNLDLNIITDHLNAGFDAIYHGPLFNNLKATLVHGQPVHHLLEHLNYTNQQLPADKLVNYISNHDDPSPESQLNFHQALITLILALPGIPFFYNGYLSGFNSRLAHHYYTQLDQSQELPDNLSPAIDKLFAFWRSENPQFTKFTQDSNQLIYSTFQSDKAFYHLVINLTPNPHQPSNLTGNLQGILNNSTLSSPILPGESEIYTNNQ